MSEFEGYGTPRFTQIPDYFLDNQMPNLTGSEVKVMLYIFRRTYGFKKSADAISYNQFLHGIKGLDQGAGVGRTILAQALNSLVERGLIFRHAVDKADRIGTTYELNIDGQPHWPLEIGYPPKSKSDLAPKSKSDLAPKSKSDLAPKSKSDLALVQKVTQQHTEIQQIEEQHTELECVLVQAGVSQLSAKNLAAKAVANNRDTGYVAQWVEWVKRQPEIRNQGAYLAGVVDRNANPPPTTGTSKLTGWDSVIAGRKLVLEELEVE